MTMRITLHNDDQVNTLKVLTRRASQVVDGLMSVVTAETVTIPPGGEGYCYLHSTQDVILQEVMPGQDAGNDLN